MILLQLHILGVEDHSRGLRSGLPAITGVSGVRDQSHQKCKGSGLGHCVAQNLLEQLATHGFFLRFQFMRLVIAATSRRQVLCGDQETALREKMVV